MNRDNTILKSGVHFYFIVIAVFFILVSGTFLTEGYSYPGLENSVLAKQFAEGGDYANFCNTIESWHVDYSDIKYSLPLGYYIEGMLMRYFGQSYMFETLYSMSIFILCAFLIVRIWVLIGNSINTGWLPLYFWLTAPVISKSATMGLLAGPFGMFILLSVAALCRGYNERRKVRQYKEQHPGEPGPKRYYIYSFIWDMLAACYMLAAFFIRGTTGFYVFLLPIVFWLFGHHEKWYWPFVDVAIIVFVFMTSLIVIKATNGVANQVLEHYTSVYMPAKNSIPNVASSFYILWELVRQMTMGLIIVAVVCVVMWKKNKFTKFLIYWKNARFLDYQDMHNSRLAYRFLVLGFICTIPTMFSRHQQVHDLIGVLPLFAICGACFVNTMISNTLQRITPKGNKVLSVIAVGMMIIALTSNLSSISKYSSDADIISDMHSILPLLEKGEVVSVTPEMANDRIVSNYYYRYKNITFDTVLQRKHMISMYPKVDHITNSYDIMQLGVSHYFLYEKGCFSPTAMNSEIDSISDKEKEPDSLAQEQEIDVTINHSQYKL